MQSNDQTKNLSNIAIMLKICNKLIKTLFKIELKYFNFSNCKEVEDYIKDVNNEQKYDGSLELNGMINLFLKNKSYSNFISILEDEEKKIFINFLKICKSLKNKLVHEEIYKVTNDELNKNLLLISDAMELVNVKYAKFKVIKSKYLQYLNNLKVN